MSGVYGQAVFALSGREYSWEDVVLAAALRGEWRAVADRAREGAGLLAREMGPDGLTSSDEEIEAAAETFRYERDLVTAEETEAWLARWGLDAVAWMGWVASDVLRRRGETVAPGSSRPVPGPDVHVEAVCSGALERLARRLAEAAAVAARLEEEGTVRPGSPEEAALASAEIVDIPFAPPPGGFDARLRELARIERAYRQSRESPVDPGDVEEIIKVHRADWVKVRALVLSLRTEDAAREALLSIRDDGRPADEVAREANTEPRREVFVLGSADEDLRDALLSARIGEWSGPHRASGVWSILRVERKTPPSADDPEIVARAETALRACAAAREVDVRVSWRWAR